MRFVYIALIVVFTALILLFKVQNFETATVSFLTFSITLPVALLLFGVYVLGMMTGGAPSGPAAILVQWRPGPSPLNVFDGLGSTPAAGRSTLV